MRRIPPLKPERPPPHRVLYAPEQNKVIIKVINEATPGSSSLPPLCLGSSQGGRGPLPSKTASPCGSGHSCQLLSRLVLQFHPPYCSLLCLKGWFIVSALKIIPNRAFPTIATPWISFLSFPIPSIKKKKKVSMLVHCMHSSYNWKFETFDHFSRLNHPLQPSVSASYESVLCV